MAPMNINEAKLKINIFCGEKNLDKTCFTLTNIFIYTALLKTLYDA